MADNSHKSEQRRKMTGRSILVHQLFLTAIALVLCAVFWFFQGPKGLVSTCVYTFVIGNVTFFVMEFGVRFFANTTPVRAWVAFLSLLIPASVAGGTLAAVAIYALSPQSRSADFWPQLRANVLIGLFITLVTGVTKFPIITARAKLQRVNQQLEEQVQRGAVRLQDLAAEATAAHDIQLHLIPTRFPQVAGVQVSGAWQPARAVGGDYFDVLSFDERTLAVCIADVAGKGMGAALLMANLQAAFRAFAIEGLAPDRLCDRLNLALCSSIAPGKFVTFFYGLLDVPSLRLRYENAGHNAPTLLRGNTAVPLEGGGMVLGLFPETAYAERTVQLQRGDCLLLTTDGITEASNPSAMDDEFGEERLVRAAQSVRAQGAHAVRRRILEEVTAFCDGHFHDDASLIVLTLDA